jgi:hypothetical protein
MCPAGRGCHAVAGKAHQRRGGPGPAAAARDGGSAARGRRPAALGGQRLGLGKEKVARAMVGEEEGRWCTFPAGTRPPTQAGGGSVRAHARDIVQVDAAAACGGGGAACSPTATAGEGAWRRPWSHRRHLWGGERG